LTRSVRSHPDVVIVGAGITGCATALALAEAGARVEVIERYGPAAMASGWTLAGVRQSGRDPAELLLARTAVDIWQTLDTRLEAPTGYRQGGNLRLARTESEAEIIRNLVTSQTAAGLPMELLDSHCYCDIFVHHAFEDHLCKIAMIAIGPARQAFWPKRQGVLFFLHGRQIARQCLGYYNCRVAFVCHGFQSADFQSAPLGLALRRQVFLLLVSHVVSFRSEVR
jgi:glycine/D-amino acid oxidase-like deaminating enzyme